MSFDKELNMHSSDDEGDGELIFGYGHYRNARKHKNQSNSNNMSYPIQINNSSNSNYGKPPTPPERPSTYIPTFPSPPLTRSRSRYPHPSYNTQKTPDVISLPAPPNYQPNTTVSQQTVSNVNLEEERKKLIVRGTSGLRNIGNTCYMNSILQCLASINTLNSWLREEKYFERLRDNKLLEVHKNGKKIKEEQFIDMCKNTVAYSLAEVFKAMWGQHCTVVPKHFKKVVGDICPTFRGFDQNDSQELLNLILDRIHEETKATVDISFKNIPESIVKLLRLNNTYLDIIRNEDISLEEKEKSSKIYKSYIKENKEDHIISKSYIFWKKYVKNSHSIITDLFTGIYYSKITCGECNTISGVFEPFTVLSVPTKDSGDTTLAESLDEFTKEETLTDENKYFCDECNKKVNAKKKMYLWEPPEVLIIQLKRFKNDKWRTTKTSSNVAFPITGLDLSKYFSDLHVVNGNIYDLCAISEHKGMSCNAGHYIACCKNSINGLWYEFDDRDVTHVPDKDLEKEIMTQNAYILFYTRRK
jgi:ubiquitin carboxyl-terminal hydrolase 8